MFLQTLELTTALRPELLPDESLLFVQDAVGLYEGKFKIPKYQNGYAYLTSHRICYVDNADPRLYSTAIDLKTVDRYDFYAGFLKSSPKITLYPRPSKGSFPQLQAIMGSSGSQRLVSGPSSTATAASLARASSPNISSPSSTLNARQRNTTWVCPICSLPNPLPANFDPVTSKAYNPLPSCLACGIKPPLGLLLKAAISTSAICAAPSAQPLTAPQYSPLESSLQYRGEPAEVRNALFDPLGMVQHSSIQCARCTFQNHPSLLSCELCGESLLSANASRTLSTQDRRDRSGSLGPLLENPSFPLDHTPEYVKISFRAGGGRVFHERLKDAMIQRKWLLHSAPPFPQPSHNSGGFAGTLANLHVGYGGRILDDRPRVVGIAGLERRGLELRKTNEAVIGNAFEDLEALMASAKEVIALAESFASTATTESVEANAILKDSGFALGMVTTKTMLGSSASADSLYTSELSRNLAEYMTDDRRGILRAEGGIISLVDLWAMFHRASNGVETIYPAEFEKATGMWEKLGLPVRLRKFRKGLLVVQRHDWTDDKCIAQLLAWLEDLTSLLALKRNSGAPTGFGKGVTAQEAATRFGWSVGVANEELDMAEEKGALCREESVEGLRFWINWLTADTDIDAHGGQS